jgi:hypothetical protein
MFSTIAIHLRYACIIVVVVLIVILFSKWTGSPSVVNVINQPASTKATASMLVKESQELAAQVHSQPAEPFVHLMLLAHAEAFLNAAELVAPAEAKALQIAPQRAVIHAHQQQLMHPQAPAFTHMSKK